MRRLGAAAFLLLFAVPASAMAQRLVRAKRRIRDAGIAFVVPTTSDLPVRLPAVLEAIYAAYGSGWDDLGTGGGAAARGLTEEAIWLARLTVRLLPEEPEPRGLLALMLYAEARAAPRRRSQTRNARTVPALHRCRVPPTA